MPLLLTIAIPTYNRAGLLEQRLRELLPQAREGVEILVCDDGSTDETLRVCEMYRAQGIRICAAVANMGLSMNMLRAFQEARGEWLWTLGDDDAVRDDGVATALGLIEKHGDAAVIVTRSETLHFDADHSIDSLAGFFDQHGPLDASFMSANLYHLAQLRGNLKVMGLASFTLAPHCALMNQILERKAGRLQFSTVGLLGPCDSNRRWSSLEFALGTCVSLEFIRDPVQQRRAAIGTWYQTRWMQKYGLREVYDGESFSRWKRFCRTSDLILKSHRVSLLRILLHKDRTLQALKTGLLLAVFHLLPFFVLKGPIAAMRARQSGDKVLLDV